MAGLMSSPTPFALAMYRELPSELTASPVGYQPVGMRPSRPGLSGWGFGGGGAMENSQGIDARLGHKQLGVVGRNRNSVGVSALRKGQLRFGIVEEGNEGRAQVEIRKNFAGLDDQAGQRVVVGFRDVENFRSVGAFDDRHGRRMSAADSVVIVELKRLPEILAVLGRRQRSEAFLRGIHVDGRREREWSRAGDWWHVEAVRNIGSGCADGGQL